MKDKRAVALIEMIIGLILIILLTVIFIWPLISKKGIADKADINEIERAAGSQEEKCKCIKGILQGETQVCEKQQPSGNYDELDKPAVCKAWIDCNDKCYKKIS